ncbi:MAG TPA: D-alanyl-lipoteichoic acid biosynthesis protein DltD [Anaerolineales bacterium]|nr:D-alanyl-lipoteichoic acid biosynthesis protein DltD [Anaerolineales bacterium]
MKQAPHLFAAAISLVICGAIAAAFVFYAGYFEKKYVHAVAALDHSAVNAGAELDKVALKQNDLLLIYGASELMLLDTKYQANQLFSTYPTGFMVYNDTSKGGSGLTIAQKLASLGKDLQGKRLIIAVGPAIMTMAPLGEVNTRHYDGNFSELHALELALSFDLSPETKELAARRMLGFPETLQDKPLLKFILENLAQGGFINHILYYLSWPLGEIEVAILHLEDHYATVNFIRHLSAQEVQVVHQPEQIQWSTLLKAATREQVHSTTSNHFGVDDSQWPKIKELFAKPVAPGSRDNDFIYDVDHAEEWDDLDIALHVAQELGAQPIILSSPMNVPLWEKIGVSEFAQNEYYTKLRSVVAPYGFPIIDFQQYDKEPYFSMDLASHVSRKGWIYVDQTLDEIFHGNLP